MKLKSLMLGVAAAATATTAQAADLPVAPEPVDYVRICDAYGARFYYIPGTETCLRVGGRVRTQIQTGNVTGDTSDYADSTDNGYSWLARGSVRLDARTATEYGTLRTYVAIDGNVTNDANSFAIDNAYIQWGGLVSGHATSNFDIFTGQAFIGSANRDWSDETTNQLAYTAAFGNGMSATLAIEDNASRQVGTSVYGGTRLPDLVAALAVTQGWGGAQLSGALHQVQTDRAYSGNASELGWAVGAGVGFNLPMLASGSNIFFQGFYADGALSYIGGGSTERGNGSLVDVNTTGTTSKGFSLSSGIYHQATSTIGLALDGSYMMVDQAADLNDLRKYAVDGSVAWTPVSGLSIGADAGYSSTKVAGQNEGDLRFGVRMERSF